MNQPDQNQGQYPGDQGMPMQNMGYIPGVNMGGDYDIKNVVDRIDPALIIDNLDHALKGEFYNKEVKKWMMNEGGVALVNPRCRGAIISYVTGVLNNNSTLSIINEKQLSHLMESIIESITRMFVTRLEEFGFVPPGPNYAKGDYHNIGIPDSARMTLVANMVYSVIYLTYSRALNGMESRKIFGSLSMSDSMGYNQQPKHGLGNLFK